MADDKDLAGDLKLQVASGEVAAVQDAYDKAISRAKAAFVKEHRMGRKALERKFDS